MNSKAYPSVARTIMEGASHITPPFHKFILNLLSRLSWPLHYSLSAQSRTQNGLHGTPLKGRPSPCPMRWLSRPILSRRRAKTSTAYRQLLQSFLDGAHALAHDLLLTELNKETDDGEQQEATGKEPLET